MEALAKFDGFVWTIEVSWDGWITFGEFLHGVFDALKDINGYFSYPQVYCDKEHKDDYDWKDGDQGSVEIVSKGYCSNLPSLIVQDRNGFSRTASIGIETVEHIDKGRRVREFRILGVEFWEAFSISVLKANKSIFD